VVYSCDGGGGVWRQSRVKDDDDEEEEVFCCIVRSKLLVMVTVIVGDRMFESCCWRLGGMLKEANAYWSVGRGRRGMEVVLVRGG